MPPLPLFFALAGQQHVQQLVCIAGFPGGMLRQRIREAGAGLRQVFDHISPQLYAPELPEPNCEAGKLHLQVHGANRLHISTKLQLQSVQVQLLDVS
jgi:hypothetical protein